MTELIDIPIYLDDDEYHAVKEHFHNLGVHYESVPLAWRDSPRSVARRWTVSVPEDHARAAALVVRNVLEIDDPATMEPFSGPCPACGEEVAGALVCPSCEIDFLGEFDEESPIVVFFRRYGAFDDS